MRNQKPTGNYPSVRIYKFADFYLNTFERKLMKDGQRIDITTKAFDILQLLVENAGEIVTKEKLLDEVWGDRFVEEGNLPVYISKLRKHFGSTRRGRYIETVSGEGYRFLSKVELVGKPYQKGMVSSSVVSSFIEEKESEISDRSLVVLPLQNVTNDAEIDYLADGITENVINCLSSISDLRVMSRSAAFSYKNKALDIRKVRRELKVAHILIGRLQLVNRNLIITVELIKTDNENQIWEAQFKSPLANIFEIQSEITREISNNLRSKIENVSVSLWTPSNTNFQSSESYRLFLKGKFFIEKRSIAPIKKAIKYFKRSAYHDRDSLYPYLGLVEGYWWLYVFDVMSYMEVKTLISSLMEYVEKLDDDVPELYRLKGIVALCIDWDFVRAENCFLTAVELKNNYLHAHLNCAWLFSLLKRDQQAQLHMLEADKLDPVSIFTNRLVSRVLWFRGEYESACDKLTESLELYPDDASTLSFLGVILVEMGKFEAALRVFEKSARLQTSLETTANIGYAHASAGNLKKATEILEKLEHKSLEKIVPAAYPARIHAALGEMDMAFKHLEQAYNQHDSELISLLACPRWASIRDDLRYDELIEKVGFPVEK